jgi:hypothetical protein
MIELVEYGRYRYRRIAALLRDAGWQVNDKRIERLWRREGLKVLMKRPKKGRHWLDNGSCNYAGGAGSRLSGQSKKKARSTALSAIACTVRTNKMR